MTKPQIPIKSQVPNDHYPLAAIAGPTQNIPAVETFSGATRMRVFVTGAAGFIGSRLSKALIARGDQVIGFDNLNDYYPLLYKDRNLADLLPSNWQFTFI